MDSSDWLALVASVLFCAIIGGVSAILYWADRQSRKDKK